MAMTPLEYLKQADKEIAAGNSPGGGWPDVQGH